MLGCAIRDSSTPGVTRAGLAFLEVVACSLLAAVPLAGVFMVAQRWRRSRHSKWPAFSWCAYAGMLCFMAVVLLDLIIDQQPYWPHVHRVVGLVSLSLALAGTGFCLEAAHRSRRLSKGVASGSRH
jgi:arginine exporter protein ArgO